MKSPLSARRCSLPWLAAAAVALSGCAARMERATVMQAARDFKCSEENVAVEKLAFAEYRATGCGQTTSYQIVGECYFDWNPCHAARLGQVETVPPRRAPAGDEKTQ